MSKKILKRSLALGAMMAFVITGSVWAEEYITKRESISSAKTPDNVLPYKVNSSDKQGGAFYINSTGILTLNNKKFEECVAIDGGAIANVGGTLNMVGCDFEKNSPTKSGSSKYQGAAVFNSDGIGEWNSCTFDNNSGSPAVWVTGSNSNVIIVNNKFINNSYGGIQIDAGEITITGKDNKFENNSVKGGIYVSATGVVNFDTDSVTTMSKNNVDIYTKGTTKVNIGSNAKVTSGSGILSYGSEFNINGGTLELGANSTIENLGGNGGTIKYLKDVDVTVTKNTSTGLNFVADGDVNDAVNGNIEELIGDSFAANDGGANFKLARGSVAGEVEGTLEGVEVEDDDGNKKFVYRMKTSDEKPHEGNAAISHNANIAMMAWRAETNDMNKRLGELRNANGDLGVWVRMVGGEDEFKSVEYEYTQYQLGYDEKLSVDPSWTVGVALSYTDGESKFTDGSGENTHKGLSVYGSKLNDDGSFIDLIAKYSRLEHDLTSNTDKGDYSTNGYSVSAEYGKRYQQGKGLWIEPQVELTYGKVKSAEYQLGDKTVSQDAMESLVGRVGFSLGKDISKGNVYARASYLYDFEGETNMAFANSGARREFKYDLGGGWWEVGVGANINLSKATYIYADIEKTFGGEVDTNWQWNLGVRYSF